MKKRWIVLAAAFAAFSSTAFAVPQQWTCDPNPADEQVTEYRLYMDGVKVASTPAPPWPVIEVTPGKHTFTATALNLWGEGPASDPVMLPPAASKAKNLHR